VLVKAFVTNKFPPDTAMPVGVTNPETSEALIAAPVVALYSPIVFWQRNRMAHCQFQSVSLARLIEFIDERSETVCKESKAFPVL
jgi:hypothetical protein